MSLYVLFLNVDICVLCCRKVFKSRLNFPQDVVIDYEVGSGNKYTNICDKHVLADTLRLRYVARTPPVEACSRGRLGNVENAPR